MLMTILNLLFYVAMMESLICDNWLVIITNVAMMKLAILVKMMTFMTVMRFIIFGVQSDDIAAGDVGGVEDDDEIGDGGLDYHITFLAH